MSVTLTRIAVTTLVLAAGLASTVHARVTSLSLSRVGSVIPGRYVARGNDSAAVNVKSLAIDSVEGNPGVTFRLFMAPGATPAPAEFAERRSWTYPYRVTYTQEGEEKSYTLEEYPPSFSLDTLLRDLPGGIYSLYLTADDGTGAPAASSVLTLELATTPEAVVAPIRIERSFSPAAGIVVVQLAPLVFEDDGMPTVWYSVYRAKGETTALEEFEPILFSQYFPVPLTVLDTGDGAGRVWRELVIAGLGSGPMSLYVVAQLEPTPGKPTIASNIVSVHVAGERTIDSPTFRLMHTSLPTSVRPESIRTPRTNRPDLY